MEPFGGIIINGDVNVPRVSMPASCVGTVLVYMRLNSKLSMMSIVQGRKKTNIWQLHWREGLLDVSVGLL